MKIKSLMVDGVGGLNSLDLRFSSGLNIICGPNGIGKTTVLECIAHAFTLNNVSLLKRNALKGEGGFVVSIEVGGEQKKIEAKIKKFNPGDNEDLLGLYQHADKILSLKVSRTINYVPLNAVVKDTHKSLHDLTEQVRRGLDISDVKSWFVNRYLYSAYGLSETQLSNLDLAKKCFSILQDGFSFSHVIPDSNEIMVSTPSGDIYYEYLSSGFKSTLAILFGIIKEIEFRFKEPSIEAVNFDGVVLVDELELHLHPAWQARIARTISKVFPRAQFIVTTHSPHVIQSAQPHEVIALSWDEGAVVRKELQDSEYGFQGWTVEEVLTDVMGMEDTRTGEYHSALTEFACALQREDQVAARTAFVRLDKMLHPGNQMRKLLSLQLAAISSEVA